MKTDIAFDWNFFTDTVLQVVYLLDEIGDMKGDHRRIEKAADHDYYDMLHWAQSQKMNCIYRKTLQGQKELNREQEMRERITREEVAKANKRFADRYGSETMIKVDECITQAYCNGFENGIRYYKQIPTPPVAGKA